MDIDNKYYEIKTQKSEKCFIGHDYGVKAVIMTSDNKYVISGSGDKTIRCWCTETDENFIIGQHDDWI
jgi:WD40 repeat protein